MNRLGAAIEADRPDARDASDIDFPETRGIRDPRQRGRRLADDGGLGQRRALIRGVRLLADQRHAAVEPLLTQRNGRARAGFAGADDDDFADRHLRRRAA